MGLRSGVMHLLAKLPHPPPPPPLLISDCHEWSGQGSSFSSVDVSISPHSPTSNRTIWESREEASGHLNELVIPRIVPVDQASQSDRTIPKPKWSHFFQLSPAPLAMRQIPFG